jgi:hypothetical protein
MDRLIEPSFVCERPTQAAFCVSGQLPKAQTGGTQRRHQRRAHRDESGGAPVEISGINRRTGGMRQDTQPHRIPNENQGVPRYATAHDGLTITKSGRGAPWELSMEWILATAATVMVISLFGVYLVLCGSQHTRI